MNWQLVGQPDIHFQLLLETEEFSCSKWEEFAEANLVFNTFWYWTMHQLNYNLYELKNESQICIMINSANKAITWIGKVLSHQTL